MSGAGFGSTTPSSSRGTTGSFDYGRAPAWSALDFGSCRAGFSKGNSFQDLVALRWWRGSRRRMSLQRPARG